MPSRIASNYNSLLCLLRPDTLQLLHRLVVQMCNCGVRILGGVIGGNREEMSLSSKRLRPPGHCQPGFHPPTLLPSPQPLLILSQRKSHESESLDESETFGRPGYHPSLQLLISFYCLPGFHLPCFPCSIYFFSIQKETKS